MDENQPARDRVGQLDRRTLLKLTGGAAVSTVAASGVAAARGRGNGNGNSNGNGNGNGGGKQGGRGQTSDLIVLNEPFTVSNPNPVTRKASCMSENSAEQEYMEYDYEYCSSEYEGGTFCVIPEQSEVNQDRVYEFRSEQECKGDHSSSAKFAFGPANTDC